MKNQIRITFTIIIFILSIRVNCQEKFSDFFTLVYYKQDSTFGFYPTPDSLKHNSKYAGFAQKLWGFNMYLYSVYSKAEREYRYLQSFLPDSNKIRTEHERLLNEDREFQDLFYATLYKKNVPDISIDSMLIIISRFTYLHTMDSDIVIHMCVAINGVSELPVTIGSPYYNAFGYMIQYSDDCSEIVQRIKNQYKDEIALVKQTLNEEKITELRTEIYESLRNDIELRHFVIHEYEEKKEYLNFRIIY